MINKTLYIKEELLMRYLIPWDLRRAYLARLPLYHMSCRWRPPLADKVAPMDGKKSCFETRREHLPSRASWKTLSYRLRFHPGYWKYRRNLNEIMISSRGRASQAGITQRQKIGNEGLECCQQGWDYVVRRKANCHELCQCAACTAYSNKGLVVEHTSCNLLWLKILLKNK